MVAGSNVANAQLKSIVDRLERLEEEKKAISDDIREVLSEAKGNGFDSTIIKMVLKERKKDASARAEQLELFSVYWDAVHTPVAASEPEEQPDTTPEAQEHTTLNDEPDDPGWMG